jgi:hypothetical protein
MGKPEGGRRLGRPRRWWVDNIKIDLEEIGWSGVDWIGLAQDGVSCECGNAPSGSINAGKFSNGRTIGGLLSNAHLH